MSSVAMTDAIQCAILLASFWIMPMLCDYEWGGFGDIAEAGCKNMLLTFSGQGQDPPAYGTTKEENWQLSSDMSTGKYNQSIMSYNETSGVYTAESWQLTDKDWGLNGEMGMYNVTYTGCWMYSKGWLALYPPRYVFNCLAGFH
jgi:hypothetical protein